MTSHRSRHACSEAILVSAAALHKVGALDDDALRALAARHDSRRKAFATTSLSASDIDAIAASRIAAEHASLDKLPLKDDRDG
ncbi:hypothetical protein MWN34_10725 [Ancylobacter sp. 6x-1]|uniref:DUF1127 domain-containing protein n=1 Tax=Ancylobacter crimeensis TaxID=2579147 RepID=A0ABT0DBP6_9HYPH|nr:hypothetical protein [Ancylobacter crimeensis]MCK0197386.1 hypothetical protein [Ancylobacter crimeensis]